MHAAFGRLLDAQQSLETANQRLATAERRTEALLHESMHRFRNDLQRLSSTISLQVSSSNDPAVHAALAEIQARVSALASIKSRLDATQITSEQTTLVDTSAFLSGLVEDWSASVGTKSISFTVHVQPHYVPASRAVVLGLILNELITNAIKYAFPNHAAGTIWVKFKRLNGEYNLRVEDNGVGHDPERAPEGTGLGARIIHGLTRQLGGRLEIASREDGGTVCSLVVPAVAGA